MQSLGPLTLVLLQGTLFFRKSTEIFTNPTQNALLSVVPRAYPDIRCSLRLTRLTTMPWQISIGNAPEEMRPIAYGYRTITPANEILWPPAP